MSLWLDMLGAQVDYIDLQPYRTRYVAAGQGEPVVLVHGTGGHLENFGTIFRSLQQRYTVYAFDLAGHGLSDKPSTDYNIPDWGGQLHRFIQQVAGKPAYVVGHSLGGWIGAWVAMHQPASIRKFVSLTGIGFELSEEEGEALRHFQRFHRDSCAKEPTKEAVRYRMSLLVEDRNAIPDEWVEVRYALYANPETRQVMIRWVDYITDLLGASDQVRRYMINPNNVRKLEMPILFVAGEKDAFTPLAAIERVLPYCRNAKLHVVKDAGHWPHVEKPEEVGEAIHSFFQQSFR